MIFKNLRRTSIKFLAHNVTYVNDSIPRYNSFYIPYSARVNIIWKYHGQKDGLKVYICKYIVKNLLLQLNITFIKITIIIGLGSLVYIITRLTRSISWFTVLYYDPTKYHYLRVPFETRMWNETRISKLTRKYILNPIPSLMAANTNFAITS